MTRPSLGRARAQVTLPPELLARLDAEASRLGTTRSDLLERGALMLLASTDAILTPGMTIDTRAKAQAVLRAHRDQRLIGVCYRYLSASDEAMCVPWEAVRRLARAGEQPADEVMIDQLR